VRYHGKTCDCQSGERSTTPSSQSTPMHGGRFMYESTNPHDFSALMWDGLKHSLDTLHHIIKANNPSVILLQDCRVRPNDEATMLQTLRERFVDFHPFIASGFRQRTNRTSKRMSGQMRNQSYTIPTSNRHAGRMLTVHVQPPSPLLPFQVTSYYRPVADASEDQRECLESLRARLTVSARTGCLHIVGGDFNASLFPAEHYGYWKIWSRYSLV
jgi:exonuclease III